ncbi:paraquat-inducible protein A, partial [Paraburkholderia sp. BR14261]
LAPCATRVTCTCVSGRKKSHLSAIARNERDFLRIVIPLAKLGGMVWFITSVLRHSRRHLRAKAHLYRWIDELGRWSNVDVFTIAAFVPLIHFDGVAVARPDTGATAFALVVFFTMLASRSFDPRMMWDVHRRRKP